MIKLIINISLLLFVISCQMKNQTFLSNNKNQDNIGDLKNNQSKNYINNSLIIKYVIGEPYFIEGVEYLPEENYNYNEVGLGTFYGKELHNKRTLNNDFNKVTDLLGRHKTLPLPSIVKVTNLENGLSLIIKINDRHNDNSSIIQVSRKTAQLLKFYSKKIAKIKIEILKDPSKQMKAVTESKNELNFNETINSSPTMPVSIIDIEDDLTVNKKNDIIIQPIELGSENILNNELFLKIYNFSSYDDAKLILAELNIKNKFTTQKEGFKYSLIIGPLSNENANKLVLSFISKGYKKTEFILQ